MAIPITAEDFQVPRCQILGRGQVQLCQRKADWVLTWAHLCDGTLIPHNVCEECRMELIKERANGAIWQCPSHPGMEFPLALVMREWERIT